jgi:hypothetical protein
VYGTPSEHPVFLQIASATLNSFHFICGADDSPLSLHRHLEKKELEVIKGVEHHVNFVAVTLNTALEVVRRKGESALFREERKGEVFVESSATRCRFAQSRRRACGSLLSHVSWGSGAAGRTIEDRCGGCLRMRGSWWRGCFSQVQTAWYIRRHQQPRPNASQRLAICRAELRSHHTQPISSLPINPTLSLATLSCTTLFGVHRVSRLPSDSDSLTCTEARHAPYLSLLCAIADVDC